MLTVTIWSCDKPNKREALTQADSIWINFRTQLEKGNVDFLIRNSLDTIQCVDCEIEAHPTTEYFSSDLIFNHYLEQIYSESIKDKEFKTHVEDNLIRVNYSFSATHSQDHGYNLIFTFIKVDDKYLFTGMFVT